MAFTERNSPFGDLDQLRPALKVIRKNWLLILVLPLLGFGYARLITHQQLNEFGSRLEILIEQQNEYDRAKAALTGNLPRRLYRNVEDLENQIRILKSRDLIAAAVENLNHNITLFIVGRVRALPVGGLSGIEIEAWPTQFSPHALGADFDVEVLDSERFRIRSEFWNGQAYDEEHLFDEEVQTGDFKIRIRRTPETRGTIEQAIAQGQRFQVRNNAQVLQHYRSRLNVTNVDQTSILSLQISDIRPERGVEFLEALTQRYIEYSTAAREEINAKTDKFIEGQLQKIEADTDSLHRIIDEQREKAEIIDLSRNEQRYFQELVQLETLQEELRIQLQSLTALERYLGRNSENSSIPPPNFLTSDDAASDKVEQLYSLQLQRTQMLLDVTPNNYQVRRIDSLIFTTQSNLFEYLRETRASLESERIRLRGKVTDMESRLFRLPKSEREILAIQRRLAINDKIYSYLLEQKATNLIARAAIASNANVIEAARSEGITGPNKGRTQRNYTLFALAIALAFSSLRVLLFERLESLEELRSIALLPVSGGVPKYTESEENPTEILALKDPRNPTTEAYRSLRTNLQYLLNRQGQNTILVSSAHPGEGKSFTASNLATLIAQTGKRTLLIDFDLYKPKLHQNFGLQRGSGLSGYLIGRVPWQDAVQATTIENLDVMTSGPLPPNASELVLNDRTNTLIEKARIAYDYVVIDTPPILPITDALVLMNHVDHVLLVTHVKRATIRGVRKLEDLMAQYKLNHVSFVLNGIVPSNLQRYASKYGRRYGYGYGDGGYGDDPET